VEDVRRQCAAALGLSSVCRDSVGLACTCRPSRVCRRSGRLTGAVRNVTHGCEAIELRACAAFLLPLLSAVDSRCGGAAMGAQFNESVLHICPARPRDLQMSDVVCAISQSPSSHHSLAFIPVKDSSTTPGFRLKPLPVSAHTATPLQPHSMQLSQRLTPSLTTGCQRRSAAALSAPCTRRARCRLVASTAGADQPPQSVTPAWQEPARSAHPAPANQPKQLNQGGASVKVGLGSNQTNQTFADLCCCCCC
jgi:hypothetical protein